jgi:hypothetical protein
VRGGRASARVSCGSAGRLLDKGKAPNLNGADLRGRSSDGRALQSHCRGQGFDSPRLHQGSQALTQSPKTCRFAVHAGFTQRCVSGQVLPCSAKGPKGPVGVAVSNTQMARWATLLWMGSDASLGGELIKASSAPIDVQFLTADGRAHLARQTYGCGSKPTTRFSMRANASAKV